MRPTLALHHSFSCFLLAISYCSTPTSVGSVDLEQLNELIVNHQNNQNLMAAKRVSQPTKQQASQMFFPQHHSSQDILATRPNPPFNQPSIELSEPVNQSPAISEEGARYLERYMKNFNSDGSRPALNLASINDRVARADQQPQIQRPEQNAQQNPQARHDTLQPRSDLIKPNSRFDNRLAVKKGQVDDVALFPPYFNSPHSYYPHTPGKPAIGPYGNKLGILGAKKQNCLSESTPRTSKCEDELIKRLSQDATEGRTVIDVGRRVCCALFKHKDCISDIVLSTCPDSSPAAADYLLGSRKLDLTLSCQRFNRDGCNGSTRIQMSMMRMLLFAWGFIMILRYL